EGEGPDRPAQRRHPRPDHRRVADLGDRRLLVDPVPDQVLQRGQVAEPVRHLLPDRRARVARLPAAQVSPQAGLDSPLILGWWGVSGPLFALMLFSCAYAIQDRSLWLSRRRASGSPVRR